MPKTIDAEIVLPIATIKDNGIIYRGLNDGNVMINGKAPYGTSEDTPSWKIYTSVISNDGNVLSTEIKENQKWTDYLNPFTSLEKHTNLLLEVQYDELDYEFAEQWFRTLNTPANNSGCTSFRSGNYFCRNLDWYYSNQLDFIVRCQGKYNSIGICSTSYLKTEDIENIESHYGLMRVLPFYTQDGINSEGVFCGTNVVPLDIEIDTVIPTEEIEKTLCTSMLLRFILDNFATAEEAVNYIKKHVSIYHNDSLVQQGYTTHIMVGDSNNTYVLEFIGNRLEVIESEVMTNFNLYGTTLNDDGTVYTNENIPYHYPTVENGITPLGAGLERFNLVALSDKETKQQCRELLNNLLYSNTYNSSTIPFWYSEYVLENVITLDTPASSSIFTTAINIAKQKWEERDRNNPEVWHTTHSVIYDIADKVLEVVSQEDTDNILTFNL